MNILKAFQDYIEGLEEEIEKKWITLAAIIICVLILIFLSLVFIVWIS